MQADNSDFQRHQLAEALGQCGLQLRNTAAMLDSYATLLQNIPHASASFPLQQMFQMFTPPQSGGQAGVAPAQAATNGLQVPAPAPAPARGRKRRVADPNAEVEVDGVKKRRRRTAGEKKEKDPNAPKRPPSAYLLFQNEVRDEVKKLFPDRPYIEVLGKISERWANMDANQKKAYTDATSDMRAKFEVDKAAYDSSHTAPNGDAALASPNAVAAVPSLPNPPNPMTTVPIARTAPTPAPAPAAATPDADSDEESSKATVAAIVNESSDEDESSEDESSQESSSADEAKPAPKTAASKKAVKPASKKESPVVAPAKSAKAEKENKKKDKKSKKEN